MCAGDIHLNPGPNSSKLQKLQICHANVRSLTRSKLKDIEVTLASSYDVIGLSETYLTPTVPSDLFALNGFHDIIRKDRQGIGGGVALYVRESIQWKRKLMYETNNTEAIWIELNTIQGKLLICCCYRPPTKTGGPDPNLFWNRLSSALDNALSDGYKNLVIVGDLNADPSTHQGRVLSTFCQSFNLSIHIQEPTRITSSSATILDQILTNIPSFVNSPSVLPPITTSDHCVIGTKLNFKIFKENCYNRHIWEFNKTNFNDFRLKLSETNFDHCFEDNDVDVATQFWSETFLNTARETVPNKIVTIRPNDIPWYSNNLRLLKRRVHRAFRKFKSHNSPINYTNYKNLRNIYQEELSKAEDTYKQNLASTLHSQRYGKKWWQKAKVLLGKGSKSQIPSLKVQNNVLIDDTSKAEAFNNFFLNHSNLNDQGQNLPSLEHVPVNLTELVISETDVLDQLKALDPTKSTGPDGISPKLLKVAADIIAPSLTTLFNLSLNQGRFPQFWKNANVLPLHKKGSMDDLNNYRPVSLLSCVGKIFEKVVHKHVFNYIRDKNLLSEHQSGFKKNDSTTHQLVYLYHTIAKALNNKTDVKIFFL